jgi:hypothetical protein
MQVPSGVFVFLNDIDFVPTPTLHSELTVGKWKSELQRMRSAYFESQTRETLVLPAFERLGSHGKATPWNEPCEAAEGCEMFQDMALPRTFDMLRKMLHRSKVVDVFHRAQVRSAFSRDKRVCLHCNFCSWKTKVTREMHCSAQFSSVVPACTHA